MASALHHEHSAFIIDFHCDGALECAFNLPKILGYLPAFQRYRVDIYAFLRPL